MGVEKRHVGRGGKNIIFRRGGGINIVFGPKYRPLFEEEKKSMYTVADMNFYVFGIFLRRTTVQNNCYNINEFRGNRL